MRIILNAPHRAQVGTTKDNAYVYFMRGGILFARAHNGKPANPKTEDQVAIRAFISANTKAWKDLTAGTRQNWEDYLKSFGRSANPNRTALDQYVLCNVNRNLLGLTSISTPPTDEVAPAQPDSLVFMEATDENDTKFYITHSIPDADVANYKILVKQTAPMGTVAQTPRSSQARLIKGVPAGASAVALNSSGVDHPYDITAVRFPVDAGQRFGVSVSIVLTGFGLASPFTFNEGIKAFM